MALASDLNNSQQVPNGQLKNTSATSLSGTDLGDSPYVYQGVLQPRDFPSLPPNWTSEWETFPSSDGKLQLFGVMHRHGACNEVGNGHRVLFILHGLGEHGGRYLHVPHFIQKEVDAVYCLDHRGHGRSEGLRGHVDSFDLYADDAVLALHRLAENLKKRFGKHEIHVLGHSMGGLITLRMLLKNGSLPIRSVSLSAPLLGIRVTVPLIKKTAASVLARVWGSFHMTSEVEPGFLSHDKAVQEAYVKDRLVHVKVTPRFFIELQNAMADTLKRSKEIAYPLQIMVPMDDQIVSSEHALRFYNDLKLKNDDKCLKTYPGFYHEIFNEVGKETAFSDLAAWLRRRLA